MCLNLHCLIKNKLKYEKSWNRSYFKLRKHSNPQVSHKFKRLKYVRNHFINVKLGVFETYVKKNESFPKSLQELNIKALNYFKMLESKKYINFSGWDVFHELYKEETFKFYIENFFIMNMPILVVSAFYIRYYILKLLNKR